jgi:hypothetical protein
MGVKSHHWCGVCRRTTRHDYKEDVAVCSRCNGHDTYRPDYSAIWGLIAVAAIFTLYLFRILK